MSQSIFLICFEYIKNNLYIDFGDGNHIRIVGSCSNAVKIRCFVYSIKILETSLPVAKI